MYTLHCSFRVSAPFSALWRWLMAKPGQHSQVSDNRTVSATDLRKRTPHFHNPPGSSTCAGILAAPRQPLRVLRVMDTDLAPAQVGRLRISGRMADVCAELERLAALEAGFH